MPATATRGEGKSAFIMEVLREDPRANAAAVNEAWRAAGRPGEISAGLINHLRHRMGLSSNLRGQRTIATGRRRTPQAHAAPNGSTPTIGRRRTNDLMALEIEIDRLWMKLAAIGELPDVEDALREARRSLYSGMVDVS
jgi:hypothetical protein